MIASRQIRPHFSITISVAKKTKKKIKAFSSICLLCLNVLSAQVFFTESFEAPVGTGGSGGDCGCVATSVDVIDGQNDHFARTNDTEGDVNSDIAHNGLTDYTGLDGMFFWASEDNDDGQVGGSINDQLCLTLTADITGRSNIILSGLFGGNNAALAYDPDDNMSVEYSIDGAGFIELLDFREDAAGQLLSLDIDGDDVGDNTIILNSVFTLVSASIPGTGSSIQIQICTHSNASSEEFAFDNIQLAESVLPVELMHFTANLKAEDVHLTWATASETNNRGFDIQHSIDGASWSTIGFVEGNLNSTSPIDYQFVDTKVSTQYNYYRLKQLDYNNTFEYSPIQHIHIEKEKPALSIFPNPSRGKINIEYFNPSRNKAHYKLINSQGRVVLENAFSQKIFKEEIILPHSGFYFLISQIGGERHVRKILILK